MKNLWTPIVSSRGFPTGCSLTQRGDTQKTTQTDRRRFCVRQSAESSCRDLRSDLSMKVKKHNYHARGYKFAFSIPCSVPCSIPYSIPFCSPFIIPFSIPSSIPAFMPFSINFSFPGRHFDVHNDVHVKGCWCSVFLVSGTAVWGIQRCPCEGL